ncbi:hypothetical protein AGMMS49990_06640 [Endomicrobiia bacterium]|nr:hypothetical protein AGMMS49990_06640 [Endomicrobiia bacterium]
MAELSKNLLKDQEKAGWNLESLLGQIVVFDRHGFDLFLEGFIHKKRFLSKVNSTSSIDRLSNGLIRLLVEAEPSQSLCDSDEKDELIESKNLKVSAYDPNKDEFIESDRELTKIAASDIDPTSKFGSAIREASVGDDDYIWIGHNLSEDFIKKEKEKEKGK